MSFKLEEINKVAAVRVTGSVSVKKWERLREVHALTNFLTLLGLGGTIRVEVELETLRTTSIPH